MFGGASPDWSEPWFGPVAVNGRALQRRLNAGHALPETLSSLQACPVRFVPQTELPAGTAYEQFIFDTGQVPTRENLHDFFNGLCWLRFPQTKQRLNQLQAAEITAAGVREVRGPVRDALTLFDENAALLQAPEPLWNALTERDWNRLFVTLRPLWAQARLVLFGHALLEKLVKPYKSITAHVLREPVPVALGDDLAAWDAWLAQALSPPLLASKPFTPLPVVGVPGWWSANEEAGFYADADVFRPPRLATKATSTPWKTGRAP
ncbi:MAG: DUF3025 domain-containing protein [Hydrogenophaga sp.]|uniref:DUF3025 domain-containing protein n=1 Tax=Hydrogenophaga sp. TaxID=1904254 RepID=UPI00273079E6|nr:DUF3025 domain-containing protein [Hydrogenophaga sp.]MDP1782771.1 DUF3025 domain-containing protein [Hydrogenophaga sp.]MDP2251332.1 DUF3025 domain-containing protein [Hydrogenophaga sp.]MDZ4124476.1 DUF3025 domain-containing protein [Hydrogenophaga sp.]